MIYELIINYSQLTKGFFLVFVERINSKFGLHIKNKENVYFQHINQIKKLLNDVIFKKVIYIYIYGLNEYSTVYLFF